MSIASIGSYANWWRGQSQATQGINGTGTTSASSAPSSSLSSTCSTAANSNTAALMQAFSADLQAMLTQMGNTDSSAASSGTSATATSTTASATSPTDSTQNPNAVQRHHHHHGAGAGEGNSMDGIANQLVGQVGQSLQSGAQTTRQTNQSANLLATDVAQALHSYGANTPTSTNSPAVSTIA